MAWRKKGNIYGRKRLGRRMHKGKYFYPQARARTKTELYKVLIKTGVAHTHYYRIYHHLGRGYTLYVGPEKESHGGIRHKPTRKQYAAKIRRKWQEPRSKHKFKRTKKVVQPVDTTPVYRVKKITKGRYKGHYKDQKGRIMSKTGFHTFRAANQSKYRFVVEE